MVATHRVTVTSWLDSRADAARVCVMRTSSQGSALIGPWRLHP